MEFLLGIIASVIATFIVAYGISVAPLSWQKWAHAIIKRPSLYIKFWFNTEEKKISSTIRKIFSSWDAKDKESYLSCWSDDAVKIVSDHVDKKYSKAAIEGKFNVSCNNYKNISTEYLVFNDIRVNYPEPEFAVADVSYRFFLVSTDSGLPVIEDANELYVMIKEGDNWVVKANHDHFKYFSPRNPHLG
jgi:ketosteroid isomerase-like protein